MSDLVSNTKSCLLVVGLEALLLNSKGESKISYADYAIAMNR